MAKRSVGHNIITYRGIDYLTRPTAYTTKIEALMERKKAREFSEKYRRDEVHIIVPKKILGGEGKGQTVYVLASRGKRDYEIAGKKKPKSMVEFDKWMKKVRAKKSRKRG